MRAKQIFESPDSIRVPNGPWIEWDMVEYEPVTFCWYEGKLYWSDEIVDRNSGDPGARDFGNKDKRVRTHSEIAKENDLRQDDDEYISRFNMDYPGRLWKAPKIISFWKYPPRDQMQNRLKELDDALGTDILSNPKWIIEIYVAEDIQDSRKLYDGRYGWINIPVTDYTGSDKVNAKELAAQHAMSPMDPRKLKRPISSGVKNKRGLDRLKWRQAMYAESVQENMINENPNVIMDPAAWEKRKTNPNYTPDKYGSEVSRYDDEGNIPFGYYGQGKNKFLVIGKSSDTHFNVWRKASKQLVDRKNNPRFEDVEKIVGPERGDRAGRLFPSYKVISFWTFPKDYKSLMELVKDLNSKIKDFQIDDTWLVELPAGEFKRHIESGEGGWGSWNLRAGHQEYIPVSQYKGGYKRSEEEMGIEHLKSPMKKLNKTVPKGFGSNSQKYQEKRRWERAKPFESYYPRLK